MYDSFTSNNVTEHPYTSPGSGHEANSREQTNIFHLYLKGRVSSYLPQIIVRETDKQINMHLNIKQRQKLQGSLKQDKDTGGDINVICSKRTILPEYQEADTKAVQMSL